MLYYPARLFGITLALLLLSACQSTVTQQKQAKLDLLTAAASETRSTLKAINDGALPPSHDIHVFVSWSLVNEALAAMDKYSFALPSDPAINIAIERVRIGTTGTLPTIDASAKAKRGALEAEIALTATLVPVRAGGGSADFEFRVLSFVPRIRWFWFEPTKSEFVRAILAAKVDDVAAKLPIFHLPVQQSVDLGGPAMSYATTVATGEHSSLEVKTDIPSTLRNKNLIISKYVFLGNGVHIFASLQ